MTDENRQHPFEILLVEDNPGDIYLTEEALKECSISVHLSVVGDGIEAIAFLHGQGKYNGAPKPDLVLLDLNLPKKDGREVLAEIKTDRFLATTPVIILSTSDADMDIIKTYGLGANCYVTKPIGVENFTRTIKDLIQFWFKTAKLPSYQLLQQYRSFLGTRAAGAAAQHNLAKDSIRVLVIDDNPMDSAYVKEILSDLKRPAFEVTSATHLATGMELLENDSFDVVILDLGLSDSQGLDTYSLLAARFPNTPVIINTVLDDNDLAVRVIRAGAQDYVNKDQLDGKLLARIIQHAIERKWIEYERNELIEREKVARTEAEKAILMRDEFLSIASHELKTPITSLVLQVEVLKRSLQRQPNPSEDFVTNILKNLQISEKETKRLSELIEKLLDISRITAGRLQLNFEEVDLSDLVPNVVEKFRFQLERAKCTVTSKLEKNVISYCDRFRVEQVIINLLTNAMKYGEGHPIEISASTQGDHALIRVKDHGIGIPKEDHEKIFQRFQRSPKARNYTGLGLGLYIVRQIVDSHGGSIQVESDKGSGATFTVMLPLVQPIPALVTPA